AGVVDEHRDRTELALDGFDRGQHLLAFGDVGRRDQRFAAGLADKLGRLFKLRLGARNKPARVALAGQALRNVAPDSASRTRDQCNLWFRHGAHLSRARRRLKTRAAGSWLENLSPTPTLPQA